MSAAIYDCCHNRKLDMWIEYVHGGMCGNSKSLEINALTVILYICIHTYYSVTHKRSADIFTQRHK